MLLKLYDSMLISHDVRRNHDIVTVSWLRRVRFGLMVHQSMRKIEGSHAGKRTLKRFYYYANQ